MVSTNQERRPATCINANSFAETTPPGSGDSNAGASSPIRSVSARASASVPQNISRDTPDLDDSAPAPDIPKAKVRGNPVERAKNVEKRKSIFNFMGKKE
jgi:hypothetical protein